MVNTLFRWLSYLVLVMLNALLPLRRWPRLVAVIAVIVAVVVLLAGVVLVVVVVAASS